MKKDKGLLNEILPDPEQAARDLQAGSPRARTSAHLKKIIAAAAAAALPLAAALADNSVPGDKGKKDNTVKEGNRPTPPPDIGYGVVDPMPPPYINRANQQGTLQIESRPSGASVSIDGIDTGQKTPIKKLKLVAGMHAITVTSADGKTTQNLSIQLAGGTTLKEMFDLRPPKADKAQPDKK